MEDPNTFPLNAATWEQHRTLFRDLFPGIAVGRFLRKRSREIVEYIAANRTK